MTWATFRESYYYPREFQISSTGSIDRLLFEYISNELLPLEFYRDRALGASSRLKRRTRRTVKPTTL